MAAFWLCTLLLLFGCTFLHTVLIGNFKDTAKSLGFEIPLVGVTVTTAFLICAGIFVVGTFVIHRWQNSPRTADLLIETESELRNVTWPTGTEVVNSSIVVIVAVVLIGAFLAGSDWFLARLSRVLLFGGE